MKTIKLFNTPNGWMVRSEDYIEIMGTDTIPTAFTENAQPMTVLNEIKRLNPDYNVSFKLK